MTAPACAIKLGQSSQHMNDDSHLYTPPRWLPGGHLQTIWPSFFSKSADAPLPAYRRERWTTPDDDFIDVDWLQGPPSNTLLVLFHGLEGSSQGHYALAFADYARRQGLAYAVPHFRGCSGEINRQPRAYHSGDHEEIDWMLSCFAQRHAGPILAVGVSLGGNALMRWAGVMGERAAARVRAVASISSPLDLMASGHAIGTGINRLIYTPWFLKTMKPKALQKLAQFPGLFDVQRLKSARNLYEFDDVFTAPLHGFQNVIDYWTRASAKPVMRDIRIPALALNACNDPCVPATSLPAPHEVSTSVTLWQPQAGGHVGFAQGAVPGHLHWLPTQVGNWLQTKGGAHG